MNTVEIKEYQNSVDMTLIDIETLRYFLTQFHVTEEHKEAD